eukprot:gene1851-16614_t
MLSKVLGSGLQDFYVLANDEEEVEPVTAEMLDRLSLSVFDGDFSCCAMQHKGMASCDKEALMPAMLGLYSLVLKKVGFGRKDAAGEEVARTPGSAPSPSAKDAVDTFDSKLGGREDVDPAVRKMLLDKDRFFPPRFVFRSHEGWEEDRE